MSFLQPFILFALPLIGLPILIHLIHRHRHKTVAWGAMMFLADAKRRTRGIARLRHWFILACRMLLVAGLLLAASRPLASGWLGIAAGGQPETVIVLLDRSASMEEQDLQARSSKRSTALDKVSDYLETIGSKTRVVLIESGHLEPIELEPGASLTDLPQTGPSLASSDIPQMVQAAQEFIVANQTGRTDVWLCSDLRAADWEAQGGRWEALRAELGPLEGVRFYLLSYPEVTPGNVSITVEDVHRRASGESAELVMDLRLRRTPEDEPLDIPVQLIINGARSVLPVELTDEELVVQGHTIPLDAEVREGWGRVEIPNDANPSDNIFHFAFAEEPVYRTVIVSQDRLSAQALRLAASISGDPAVQMEARVIRPERLADVEWKTTALVVWQAPLPKGVAARQLESFASRGGALVFFPSEEPGDEELFGMRWRGWQELDDAGPLAVTRWREDQDLLANTDSGRSLPVGELQVYRYCALEGEGAVLGRFETGDQFLIRARSDQGAVYYCTTLPRASHSSLARDGVVFYALVQRALARGAASLGRARQVDAGQASGASEWQVLSMKDEPVLTRDWPFVGGVFETGEKIIAINRPASEDRTETVDSEDVERIFQGLDYERLDDRLGTETVLASEIWRLFVGLMGFALVGEALLCLPHRKHSEEGSA